MPFMELQSKRVAGNFLMVMGTQHLSGLPNQNFCDWTERSDVAPVLPALIQMAFTFCLGTQRFIFSMMILVTTFTIPWLNCCSRTVFPQERIAIRVQAIWALTANSLSVHTSLVMAFDQGHMASSVIGVKCIEKNPRDKLFILRNCNCL